jgi:hypothetical protein
MTNTPLRKTRTQIASPAKYTETLPSNYIDSEIFAGTA